MAKCLRDLCKTYGAFPPACQQRGQPVVKQLYYAHACEQQQQQQQHHNISARTQLIMSSECVRAERKPVDIVLKSV